MFGHNDAQVRTHFSPFPNESKRGCQYLSPVINTTFYPPAVPDGGDTSVGCLW